MKSYIKVFKEIPDKVYNLEWECPICKEKNLVYYFQDWKYKKKFWCSECYKVSWLIKSED